MVYGMIWRLYGILNDLKAIWYIKWFEGYMVYWMIWRLYGILNYLKGIWYIKWFEGYMVYQMIWKLYGILNDFVRGKMYKCINVM